MRENNANINPVEITDHSKVNYFPLLLILIPLPLLIPFKNNYYKNDDNTDNRTPNDLSKEIML